MRRFLGLIYLMTAGIAQAQALPEATEALHPDLEEFISSELSVRGISREGSSAFYSDFSGDGIADALVMTYTSTPGGGNAIGAYHTLFRAEGNGFRFIGEVQRLFGFPKRIVTWRAGYIEIMMTDLLPEDARCCPSGEKLYAIVVPQ